MAHERLGIVDPLSGKQPIFSADKKRILAANGEIYNHREIRRKLSENYAFKTGSDCEVILALYEQKGIRFLNDLNGIFAFALYDEEKENYLIARDHMGIIPLYMGWDKNKVFYVASELKALEGVCEQIELFPPGHYLTNNDSKPVKWYNPNWVDYHIVSKQETNLKSLRDALCQAVKRQLMSDVPYGVLLSGGLDSSITSAIAKLYADKRVESDDQKTAWWPHCILCCRIKRFSRFKSSSKSGRLYWHCPPRNCFTIQEGLDAIKDVIYHLETYDVTTIRASTPMFLMARVIKSMGIKMVLSGEGSDEIFGGYLYFHKAPNDKEFHQETVRKLDKLHQYDCLRANKALASWGIEGRVLFLDKEFMDVAMSINPKDKMINEERMEKWVLRKAFENLLPEEVVATKRAVLRRSRLQLD